MKNKYTYKSEPYPVMPEQEARDKDKIQNSTKGVTDSDGRQGVSGGETETAHEYKK